MRLALYLGVVLSLLFGAPLTAADRPWIVQTNHAGDNIHLIDPATNKVVSVITGVEAPHGAAVAPDGHAFYFTSEADHTVDVVDGKTLKVTKKIPLSGLPNNVTIGKDGRRLYVGIIEPPGAVDVIDTMSLTKVKTIPTHGGIHNLYVTPDGKYVVAGSTQRNNLIVIDTKTEAPEWALFFDAAVRPMAFERNPDGSTKRIFVQSNSHGFHVVDFAKRQKVAFITLPDVPPAQRNTDPGVPSHGIAMAPDEKTLWVNSRWDRRVYQYSVPDLKLLGGVEVGASPLWVTVSPDSKSVYVANCGDNDVTVIDVRTIKQVSHIPVGQCPERNIAVMVPDASR